MPRHALLWLAFLMMPLLVGCEGCRPGGSAENQNGEEEKAPLEAYTTKSASIFPKDQNAAFDWVKPGHWMTAEQSIRSNKADMRGELISQGSVTLRDSNLDSIGIRQSMETIRPVTLPKGQMRSFDFQFRVPVPNAVDTRRINISSRLIPRSGGVLEAIGQPFNVMRGSEYFFVVLTSRPDQFTRIQVADWARSSESQLDSMKPIANYRIVVPNADGLLPLPETMLNLTSTGVILWDDLSEDALTPSQQLAISDWIRFGGRMVVNGPSASESIANTTLADLLPLVPTSNIELSAEGAQELLAAWEVSTDRSTPKQSKLVESESSRIAIDGQLDPEAKAIEKTGSLILEKRVGRGHVVQSRFDLTEDWIEGWDSYDSFFNSVILNRPARVYQKPNYSEIDDIGFTMSELSLFFAETKTRTDAAVNTRFRIASRDCILGIDSDKKNKRNSSFDPAVNVNAMTGIAAWDDESDVVTLFRDALANEAGIEIPGASLVVRSLALYLIILVPVNYLVFRLMNRLEYAWFAVPLIAVAGAAWAARQARLDIGFARSNTELALLEIHPDYQRAHLTRMVGVYNSLSSRYDMQFPTQDGVASPLENEPDPGTTVVPSLRVSFEEGPSLANFAVPSNRVRYVHSEEMVDLGGALTVDQVNGKTTLSNVTGLDLLDAIAVSKDSEGAVSVAYLGSLRAGESEDLDWVPTEELSVASEMPMQTARLIQTIAAVDRLVPGESQLVARVDGTLAGMSIDPPASQHNAQTLVLLHLAYPELIPRDIDRNLPGDFRKVIRDGEQKPSGDTPSGSDAEEGAPE